MDGSAFALKADLVIKALGFDPEDLPGLFGAPELKVSRWGTISVSYRTMMTNLEGVFGAGDIIRGASLVVWGIRDGRDAAASIDAYLRQKAAAKAGGAELEIGRASCRDRVCQYVEISGVAGCLQKKQQNTQSKLK